MALLKPFIASLMVVWLSMAISSTVAQNPPVLDTDGQPLRRGVDYYVLPGIFDVAGGLTLFPRNDRCPLYVGQEPLVRPITSPGLPVFFTPYDAEETIIRESRDYRITFNASTTCVQSTSWRVGDEDPATRRRFIVVGGEPGYFTINQNQGDYNLAWCPNESCPRCRPRCGTAGILRENERAYLALDGNPFPFRFVRA